MLELLSPAGSMEALRAAHDAFDGEADVWLLNTANDHVLGIGRYWQGEKLLALFNFSDEEQTVRLGEPERYYDLWTGFDRNAIEVTLPAGDFAWLVRKEG